MWSLHTSLFSMLELIFTALLEINFKQCVVLITDQEIVSNEIKIHIRHVPSVTMFIFDDSVYMEDIHPSERCLNYIVFHSDNLEVFENIETFMQNDNNSRYNDKKYLILTQNKNDIDSIFNSPFVRHLANIVVGYFSFRLDIPKITFYCQPYLRSTQLETFNWHFQDDRLVYENNGVLFWEKIVNGKGIEFTAASGYMVPYTDPFKRRGSIWNYMMAFVEYRNLTLVMGKTRTLMTDIYYLLDNRLIDMTFSMMMIRYDRYFNTDVVAPYTTAKIGILVPKSNPINGWLSYIIIFNPSIWILFYAVLTSLQLFFYISGKLFQNNHRKIDPVYVYGMAINQPVLIRYDKMFRCMHRRLGFFITSFAALLLTSIYSTKLSSTIIMPVCEKKIDTIEDLARSDVYLVTEDPFIPKPIGEDPKISHRKVADRIYIKDEDYLMTKYVTSKKHAYFAYKFQKVFNLNRFQNKSILKTHRLMSEILYEYYTMPYLTKNSPFLASLDIFMLQCAQYGLLAYWTGDALRQDVQMAFPLDIEKIENMAHDQVERPLHYAQIAGSFVVFASGLLMAVVAFFFEIYFKKGSGKKFEALLGRGPKFED